jgi:hypothetical protein
VVVAAVAAEAVQDAVVAAPPPAVVALCDRGCGGIEKSGLAASACCDVRQIFHRMANRLISATA